jgi:NAD(P)-dependent dehydrogenase (short-subunit alcohol dehydrogenase family)
MRLAGKTALITGAGSGLGRESALRFAAEGARIAVVDLDAAAAAATAKAIEDADGAAVALQADVTSSDDCARMVATAEQTFGALHILFNNAGIMLPADDDPIATSLEVWERTIAVNLTGVFLGCKHGIPALLRAGGGAIVNMASMVAFIGSATPQIAYAASKGGVVALTQEIAAIYARRNIRANALCPGPVRTPLSDHLFANEAERERRRVHQPMGRLATPREIANAALFLASDEASHVTGHALLVDGGITRAYTTPSDGEPA